MSADSSQTAVVAPPSGRGAFAWRRLGWWGLGSVVAGFLAGGVAAEVEAYFAPMILFPLLVGTVLGFLLFYLMRYTDIGHRPSVVFGVLLAVAVAVTAEHYSSYRMAHWRMQKSQREADLARLAFPDKSGRISAHAAPSDFLEYLRNEAHRGRRVAMSVFGFSFDRTFTGSWVWASWGGDAALILAAALAFVVAGMRLPFCPHCQTWYRTVRSARIKPSLARKIAEIGHIALPEGLRSVRYAFWSCGSGCGPTWLELSWRGFRADRCQADAWLDADHRNAIVAALDSARESRPPGAPS